MNIEDGWSWKMNIWRLGELEDEYVAFTDSERLIGDAAKNQVAMNPTNTIFGIQNKYRDINQT